MMKSKIYVKSFVAIVCLALVLSMVAVFILDPYFHFHSPLPLFGLQPLFKDGRYQNPGVVKNFEYDSIIIGNSLSQNFDTEWFDTAFGIHAIKLITPGCSIEDIRISIEMAEAAKNRSLKYVFCNLENLTIGHTYNVPSQPLPEYLYDQNVFNDVQYLLNKDVLFDCGRLILNNIRHNIRPISRAYQWYKSEEDFSRENVLKSLPLPDSYAPVEQEPASIEQNAIDGIQTLVTLAQENPHTQFYYFYSPVSIAYWYSEYLEGDVLSDMATLQYSMQQLLTCDNVRLFFPSTYEMITDLDSYKDKEHYNLKIQKTILEEMRDETHKLTPENYIQYINQYQDMVLGYDYETLFS